ncbi:MAG TPA: hypothetical protein VK901_07905, partial [Nitrospiraceae bacterium]|nr:hypothetical protein [Nitrospiraceae bacterium]
MPPIVATFCFFLLILGLFALDYDRRERTSPMLWIPVTWLLIIASRPVSSWLDGLGIYSSGVSF